MVLSGIFIFLASGALALGLTPVVRYFAQKRLGDRTKVPPLGGTAIFASFCLPLLSLALFLRPGFLERGFLALLAGSLLVMVIGIIDDIRGSSVWIRLIVEVAAAGVVYSVGIGIDVLPNPFGAPIHLGGLGLPATVLWIVIITNAINLIDGLDGLAAGSSMLILAAVLLLNWGHWQGIHLLAIFCLLGALAGFLVYNFPPASIYMGDSGSLFLGFFLSSFAIRSSHGYHGTRLFAVTALVFAIPILDMAYAVLRRWYRGVPIYSRDRDHLHHKLLQKAMSGRRVVMLFYAANMILMLALVLLVWSGSKPFFTFSILLFLSLAAFVAFQFLSDLNPGEFIGKVIGMFKMFRRRRYHLYLINRFEHQVEKKKRFDDIRGQLDDLFMEYGLHAAEIRMMGGGRQEFVHRFGEKTRSEDVVRVEFPLLDSGSKFGTVVIEKKFGREGILCLGELADVLSRHLVKIITE